MTKLGSEAIVTQLLAHLISEHRGQYQNPLYTLGEAFHGNDYRDVVQTLEDAGLVKYLPDEPVMSFRWTFLNY